MQLTAFGFVDGKFHTLGVESHLDQEVIVSLRHFLKFAGGSDNRLKCSLTKGCEVGGVLKPELLQPTSSPPTPVWLNIESSQPQSRKSPDQLCQQLLCSSCSL